MVARSQPDPGLVKDQLHQLQVMFRVYGAETFCRFMFWILRKTPEPGEKLVLPASFMNRRLVPFVWNRVQRDLDNRCRERNIMLKYRQGGYTVWCLLRRLFMPALLDPGTTSMLISRNNEYVARHFSILHRSYRLFGAVDPYDKTKNTLTSQLHQHLLHLRYSNRRELILDQLDSQMICESGESLELGQGVTLQHVVADDVAHWSGDVEEKLANMKEAIVPDGTLDMPSTANGLGGFFYEECQRARDPRNKQAEFTYFFHPWWWEDGYRSRVPKDYEPTPEEEDVKRKFRLDLEQMVWRRKKQVALRDKFQERYPENDTLAFLTSGNSFFDVSIIAARLRDLTGYQPLAVLANDELHVYHRCIRGRNYVVGADPATGRTVNSKDTDFSYAKVLDLETGKEMASYQARVTPEDFGKDLVELGGLYNSALIGVERTGDGGTVMLSLQQERYGAIYKHRDWDKQNRKVILVEGWPTTGRTRPIMLNRLAQWLRENPQLIWDQRFLAEALTFIRDAKGRPAAAVGSHDDSVMASAIAHMVRLVELGYWDPVAAESETYNDAED